MSNTSSRMFFLQTQHKLSIPATLVSHIPNGDIIRLAGEYGLEGVIIEKGLEPDKTRNFWKKGALPGNGTEKELMSIITDSIYSSLVSKNAPASEVAKVMFVAYEWANAPTHKQTIESVELAFTDNVEDETEYFRTGVVPFDDAFGGEISQGIHIIGAMPGTGKTTMLVSLAEGMRNTLGDKGSIWYFNLEIPSGMFQSIVQKGPQKRTTFLKSDRVFSGHYTIERTVEMIKNNPDPNRVVIYDGPDVAAFWVPKEERFAIEHIYMHLLSVKEHCKCIFVSSQVPRGSDLKSLTSLSGSSSKEKIADRVVLMELEERYPVEGKSLVSLHSVKNRYGRTGEDIGAMIDYRNVQVLEADLEGEIEGLG